MNERVHTVHNTPTHAQVETITPDVAARYLARKSEHQRSPRKAHVKRLAAAMKRGEWELNGEPIIFDTDGRMIDGQHRLLAAIEADAHITVLVVRGVPPRCYVTIDDGVSKSGADLLTMNDFKHATMAAACAAVMLVLDDGFERGRSVVTWPDRRAVLAYAMANRVYVERAAEFGSKCAHEGLRPPSALGGAIGFLWMHLESSVDSEQIELFAERLRTGADLVAGDPELALRRRLVARSVKAVRQARDITLQVALLTVQAWGTRQTDGRTEQGGKLQAHPDGGWKFPLMYAGHRKVKYGGGR